MGFSFTGKGSWFGGPRDSMDSGKMAGGNTTKLPAVAVRLPGKSWRDSRKYLNHYVRVTAPNGKTAVYRIGDLGPNESTGRNVDITYSGLKRLGYTEQDFPTDAQFKVEYVGKNPGARTQTRSGPVKPTGAVTGGSDLQAQARRQAAAQWLLSSSKSVADLQNRVAQAEASVSVTAEQPTTVTPKSRPTVRPAAPSNALHPGSPIPHQGPRAPTHPTAGLPNFPAYDYMAPAGTTAVSPVAGTVVKVSGSDPKNGPANGPHGPFGLSVYIRGKDGRTYYLTHMGSRTVKVGQRVGQGQRIGSVGNYAKYGGADHIHMGVSG